MSFNTNISLPPTSAVSTKLTFPCSECRFEAQSARQLSRHKAVTHTQNALKCVLCPFVTAYQTNLLRHRKDVHGICGSKGNKSCKFCGFVSEDNDTLIQHQIDRHQDILKSAQVKFAKELVSAGGEESIADFSANFESMTEDLRNNKHSMSPSNKKKQKQKLKNIKFSSTLTNNQFETTENESEPQDEEQSEFDNFWKAGFIEDRFENQSYFGKQNSSLNLMLNVDAFQNETSTHDSSRSSTPKSHSSNMMIHPNKQDTNLPATRIRRQYTCNDCGFRTVNPRQFLYHKRDTHGYKMKIVECPYCVYACQYVQKLQRHLLLVHKLTLADANTESENMIIKRKYKKSHSESKEISLNIINDQEINHSNENSINEAEFDQMNSFEMNEYLNSINQDSLVEEEEEDSQYQFRLECAVCKIKFGDANSAQKHFSKNHKNFDLKSSMNYTKVESSLIYGNTNQKKVFDISAKNIHVCNFCGYKTRWISELERHVRVHSKDKPFKCSFCEFSSKWKGDLNRHILRYHPNEQLEIDTNGSSQQNGMSPIKLDDEIDENSDHLTMTEEFEESNMGADDSILMRSNAQLIETSSNSEIDNEENATIGNGSTAKIYKCTYCDFRCNTASRFHVHYVQHLNTKPFQCSICGHRSNWEWDVTKHIKMKAQRDPQHLKARPVLIHDSGKRDYSKYNKFVVFVDQAEAELANNDLNKIDFRAKRFKNDTEEYENMNNDSGADNEFVMDTFLTPEVCFEVEDGEVANDFSSTDQNYDSIESNSTIISNKVVVKSVIFSRHQNSSSRQIQCFKCDFKHHFARVMVAHLSSHFKKKPYACTNCMFDTNWREVIINHYNCLHKQCKNMDFEMRFRCTIDENGICRIISNEEVANLEAQQSSINNLSSTFAKRTPYSSNSVLIQPNIYEEKVVIRCEVCPFITTNMKKMSIHFRFHDQSKGSLKCKYCPYYVNSRNKLIRHQKLHQTVVDSNNYNENQSNSIVMDESSNSIVNKKENSHFKQQPASIYDYQSMNENLKKQLSHQANDFISYSDNENSKNSNPFKHLSSKSGSNSVDNYFDNLILKDSVSMVNVNSMKNGNAKKFSYVCPDCPAAFKSPGDYKIHAVFHSSNYQHACPYCTYKARNKPQLCKHLYVHTAEYIAKRANSYPDGTKHLIENLPDNDTGSYSTINNFQTSLLLSKKSSMVGSDNIKKKLMKTGARKHRTKIEFPMKPVKVKLNNEENGNQKIVFNNTNLMASQEFLETKDYLQRINSGIKNRCMYRCSKCPAVFTKVNTLIYHMTLHDQHEAKLNCDLCTYSTETDDNLSIHLLLHNLTESQTALGYNFNYNCHKCPAGFSKRSRLEKHLSLHGAKFNWRCDKCDYSVRYAATLVKHRALHLINPDFQAVDMIVENSNHSLLKINTTETQLSKSNLKLKFNLSQIRDETSENDNNDSSVDKENCETEMEVQQDIDEESNDEYFNKNSNNETNIEEIDEGSMLNIADHLQIITN